MRKGKCRECGAEMISERRPKTFCSAACRTAHTNRRRDRGAQLYDLFMTIRYDRAVAKDLEVWTKICRLAERFHDDDLKAGRQSTLDIRRVLGKRAYLGATMLVKGAGRRA